MVLSFLVERLKNKFAIVQFSPYKHKFNLKIWS